MVKKRLVRKIKRLNEKINRFNRKIGLFVLGFVSSIGIFAMVVAGTLFLNSVFGSLRGYPKIVALIMQFVFVLTFYRVSKDVERNFIEGYLSGSAIFGIIIILGMIFGGLGWNF